MDSTTAGHASTGPCGGPGRGSADYGAALGLGVGTGVGDGGVGSTGVGVGVGTGVGDGVGDGVGPVLITRSTWEPAATSTPSAGLLRMTDPSGTEESGSRSIDPTARSKLARRVAGLLLGLAAQSGNRHVARPGRDHDASREPSSTSVPRRRLAADDASLLDVLGRLLFRVID